MQQHFRKNMMALAIAAALGGASGLASAAGFALIEQSASGMGNAFAGAAATAEDAIAPAPGLNLLATARRDFRNVEKTAIFGGFSLPARIGSAILKGLHIGRTPPSLQTYSVGDM